MSAGGLCFGLICGNLGRYSHNQTPFISMKKIILWLLIIRPQTLFASLCPVLVGLMVAHTLIPQSSSGMFLTALLTLLCALALQILSNLINDYYDYKRGTDKQSRVGFKRALAEGLVTEREMLSACLIALSASLMLGAVLCYIGGWVIVAIHIKIKNAATNSGLSR